MYGKNSLLYGKNICIGDYDLVTPNIIPQLDGNFSPPYSVSLGSTSCSQTKYSLPVGIIPQLDGQFSPPNLSDTSSPKTQSISIPDTNSASFARQAKFTLNRQKQLTRLQQDALLTPYTITVSPTCQNVSVQCSTGFYSQVAVPSFRDIKIGTSFCVECDFGDITVSCFDIAGEVDNTKADVKAVIFLRLSTTSNLSKGRVTVTLHHTKRKLQIQGGAKMPDKTTAPIWFTQKVLNPKFQSLAKNKSYDISNFNLRVRELVINSNRSVNDTCSSCDIQFTGRSMPEHCPQCSKYFHKKCLNASDHTCTRAPPHPGTGVLFSSLPPPLSGTLGSLSDIATNDHTLVNLTKSSPAATNTATVTVQTATTGPQPSVGNMPIFPQAILSTSCSSSSWTLPTSFVQIPPPGPRLCVPPTAVTTTVSWSDRNQPPITSTGQPPPITTPPPGPCYYVPITSNLDITASLPIRNLFGICAVQPPTLPPSLTSPQSSSARATMDDVLPHTSSTTGHTRQSKASSQMPKK